jgi:hypothetical protein
MTRWRLGDKKESRRLFERASQYLDKSKPLEVDLQRFSASLLGGKDTSQKK